MQEVTFAPPATKKQRFRVVLALALALTLALTSVPNAAYQSVFADEDKVVALIKNHDTWKYEDSNTNLFGDVATDFRSASHNDTAWKTGASPLGYPATDTSTLFGAINNGGTLVEGKASPNAYITYYFRKNFTATNIADITKLEAKIAVDDGYVLYLNGVEISRTNMPAGAVGHNTVAAGTWEPTEARANVTLDLSAYRTLLVEGVNTLAVDVHNRDNNSSDIYWGLTLDATYKPTTDVNKTPKQVNAHVGADPSNAINITYTTVASDVTKAVVRKADGTGADLTFGGEASVGGGNKYVHKVAVTGLEANTSYTYKVGNEVTYTGAFKTAPAKGSTAPIKFAYLADTQVSNTTNAKALGATLQEVANMNPDFVYLAGDITDTSTSEAQWEQLFNNSGAFPDGGQNLFGNYTISAIQGNHDNNVFYSHINAPSLTSPSDLNKIVYSYDYGSITFVMLNLEAARASATARDEQETYLRAAVAEAKARGQWTAVGFHKSLITGASHVVDGDVVEARKFWIPKFAELDVDLVLQGHDHVYSRGFVTANGYPAAKTVNSDGSINDPSNAPLYAVGGHAGGLKWYSRINYTVGTGDPLAPGYSYLDVNSANPADNADGSTSDVKQEQVITEVEVSQTAITLNTYMFKYDTTTDNITTNKYLFDTVTVKRVVPSAVPAIEASITGPDLAIADANQLVTYNVAYSDLVGANAFDTTLGYDSNVLEFVEAKSLFANNQLAFNQLYPATNELRVLTGLRSGITQTGTTDVVQFTFKAKQPVVVDDTIVYVKRADTVTPDAAGTGYKDVSANITGATKTTTLYTYSKAADINKDGKVTLADLALAIAHYQSTATADRIYDIDLSGVVDTLDFIIISDLIA